MRPVSAFKISEITTDNVIPISVKPRQIKTEEMVTGTLTLFIGNITSRGIFMQIKIIQVGTASETREWIRFTDEVINS